MSTSMHVSAFFDSGEIGADAPGPLFDLHIGCPGQHGSVSAYQDFYENLRLYNAW